MNTEKIKKDFPIFQRKVNDRRLIYLDNAATTQKPVSVINALTDYYKTCNSNIHRAIHTLGEEATERYEGTRKKTAKFINAQPKEIVFTRNTTESLNLLAFSLGHDLKKGDEIVATVMEHHSNLVPWQMLREKGVVVKFADIDKSSNLNMEQMKKMITNRTKIVAVTQASNVTGTINDIKEVSKISHDKGALVVVDAAQSAPHMPVDVQKMDADFFAFSSHKMLGPTGVGVLFGKKHHLENMRPFLRGGDMIKNVTLEETVFNSIPHKFEAGTPNIADVVAFSAALDYLDKTGMDNIRKHEIELTKYALDALSEIKGLTIYGPDKAEKKAGIISFNIDGVHPHDIASIMDEDGIAIRSGHSCAQPLLKRLGCETIARASFYIYNDKKDVDALKDAVKKVKSTMKI